MLEQKKVEYFIRLSFRDLKCLYEKKGILKMDENVGIIYICVVFFMAIKAMGNVTRVAPMDHISGTLHFI